MTIEELRHDRDIINQIDSDHLMDRMAEENTLYFRVLKLIASGASNYKELAREAIKPCE